MKTRKVLFITADQREVDNLAPALEELHYQWKHAKYGTEVEEFLDIEKPDLVILNALLPRGNIQDICRIIRQYSTAKILVTSAINSPTMTLQARTKWDLDEFVTLPISLNKMVQLVAFLLGDVDKRPTLYTTGQLMRLDNEPKRDIETAGHKISTAGDLKTVNLGRLLGMLIRKQLSGKLILGEGDEMREILLADSRILEIRSRYLTKLGLGDLLILRHLLTEAELEQLLKEAAQQQRKLGELLRERQLITTTALFDVLQEQAVEKLKGVFAWSSGRYEFKRGEFTRQVAEPLNLLLAKAAFLAARQATDLQEFDNNFTDWLKQEVMLNPNSPIRSNALTLDGDEKRFVFSLKNGKNLRAAMRESRLPDEVVKGLTAALIQLRMIIRAD